MVTGSTPNGVRTFLLQRFSAVFMAIFLLSFITYLFCYPATDFYAWHTIFQNAFVRLSTVLFFICLSMHTWIGLWGVITDYLHNTAIRLMAFIAVLFTLSASFIWCIMIVWGE